MQKKQIVRLILGVAFASLVFGAPAWAASQTGFEGTILAGGIDFTATLIVADTGFNTNTLKCTVSNCTYSLTFTGLNNNVTTSTLNNFGLQLFGSGSSASFDTSGGTSIPSGWQSTAGAKINNSGGLGCNSSNGTGGWLCGTALNMGNVLSIASGKTFTMTFAGNFQKGTSIISAFDLMANGLTDVNTGNSKWAISKGFAWNEFTPIPEPETWTVIGSGLCMAACLLRKKLSV
jgi:hypothetical protein